MNLHPLANADDAVWAQVGGQDSVFLWNNTYSFVLWRGSNGNGWYPLGRAYIAAQLNELAGIAPPQDVVESMALAYELLASNDPLHPVDDTVTLLFQQLTEIINNFNRGVSGPGVCSQ